MPVPVAAVQKGLPLTDADGHIVAAFGQPEKPAALAPPLEFILVLN